MPYPPFFLNGAVITAVTRLGSTKITKTFYVPCNEPLVLESGEIVNLPDDPNLRDTINEVVNHINFLNNAGQTIQTPINTLYVTNLFLGGQPLQPRWAKAQANWQVNGGDPIVAAKVADRDGNNEVGANFDLYLNPTITNISTDPNVETGNVIPFMFDGSKFIAIGGGHLDRKITTIEWLASVVSRQGWALADGTANAGGNGGTGIVAKDKWVQGVESGPGALAAADTGASASGAGIAAHTTSDIAGAIADHENTVEAAEVSGTAVLTGPAVHGTQGDPISHTGTHFHTPGNPLTVKLIPYERIDNSV